MAAVYFLRPQSGIISQQYTCHTVLMMKMPSLKWIHKILWQSGHIFYKKNNEQDDYPGVSQYIFTLQHVMQRTVLLLQFCLSICPSDTCIVTKLNDGVRIF